jgi:positive phototaxis protein PixI
MLTSLDSLLTATSLDLLTLDDPLPTETCQRLLRFPLGREDSALLPLAQIAEIFRVNVEDILPVPEMPSCVLGIFNWRGEMLWLIDLDHLLGYPPLSLMTATPMAVVVQSNSQPLGLVVSQVNDIELHDLQKLTNAAIGLFPPKLLPFVLGALPEGSGTVLDVTAITQCPLWQLHRGQLS